jgi:hypothetical protein
MQHDGMIALFIVWKEDDAQPPDRGRWDDANGDPA